MANVSKELLEPNCYNGREEEQIMNAKTIKQTTDLRGSPIWLRPRQRERIFYYEKKQDYRENRVFFVV